LSDYVFGKQTYQQLKQKYQLSINTIRKALDTVVKASASIIKPGRVVLGIDGTFFSKELGIILLRGAIKGVNLWWCFVTTESTDTYLYGIKKLQSRGWQVLGIVCDGKNLSLGEKLNLPIQMCHFHQKLIVQRYLTTKPNLEASIRLKQLSDLLTRLDEKTFTFLLDSWYQRWDGFLKEKTTNPFTKRKFFTHKRLRSAYRSLKRNLPFLFTFEYQRKLGINFPNTNNSTEGFFSNLKKKVNLHQGLKLYRKVKLIQQILMQKTSRF